MCSVCGALAGRPDWTRNALAEGAAGDERARLAFAQALMASRRLRLTRWHHRYIVADDRGRSRIVDDLPACWSAAEALLGEPLDPLAPGAVAAMRAAGAGQRPPSP